MNKRICRYGGHGVNIMLKRVENTDQVFWTLTHNSYVIVADDRGAFVTSQGERVSLVCINGIGEIRWTVAASDIPRDDYAPAGDQVHNMAAMRYFRLSLYGLDGVGSQAKPLILPFDKLAWREVGPPDDRRCLMVATAQAAGQDVHFHVNAYSADASNSRIADIIRHLDNAYDWESVEIKGRQYIILILPFYK